MVFSALIPKLFGARIILDIHDIGPELFMRKMSVGEDRLVIRLIKVMERLSAAFADHVITVTDFWKDKLVSRSVRASKVTLLLNVPDNELFKPAGVREEKNSFNLFYHGSIEEHFGLDTLLLAMPVIKANIPHVLLHLYCGKRGRLFTEYARLAKRLKLDSYVMFYKAVPFYDLPHTLSRADIGVVPTKDAVFSNEAVSMKALEYMSMEIPIVISRTRGPQLLLRRFDGQVLRAVQQRGACRSGHRALRKRGRQGQPRAARVHIPQKTRLEQVQRGLLEDRDRFDHGQVRDKKRRPGMEKEGAAGKDRAHHAREGRGGVRAHDGRLHVRTDASAGEVDPRQRRKQGQHG